MKIRLKFRWYDMWIGAYFERWSRSLYICLIPMFVIEIQFR